MIELAWEFLVGQFSEPQMGASRKLQGEIDRVLKKVQEGVDVFDSIWNKVIDSSNLRCDNNAAIASSFWLINFFFFWKFRFTIQIMRTRRRSSRRTWRKRLRNYRGTETKSRHGFSLARSRTRRSLSLSISIVFMAKIINYTL